MTARRVLRGEIAPATPRRRRRRLVPTRPLRMAGCGRIASRCRPVMLRSTLSPGSGCLCVVVAKRVDQVEAVSGVVTVVELLREKWRELFRVVNVLADRTALNSRRVGPGVGSVNLPVLSVIVAAPELPRPLK